MEKITDEIIIGLVDSNYDGFELVREEELMSPSFLERIQKYQIINKGFIFLPYQDQSSFYRNALWVQTGNIGTKTHKICRSLYCRGIIEDESWLKIGPFQRVVLESYDGCSILEYEQFLHLCDKDTYTAQKNLINSNHFINITELE